MGEKNFGILASVDWNSNQWKDLPTTMDLANSNFGYVVDNGITFTSFNFAQDTYPADEKGFYRGLLPQLWSRMPDKEKSQDIEVVFIKSQNWEDKQTYIVGFYAFPVFERTRRPSPVDSFPSDFESNIKAFPKDIHLLDTYINLTAHPDLKKFLPKGKELGKQGYNYLTRENVFKLLDAMTASNPSDRKLSGIKYRLLMSIDKKK